MVNGEIDLSVGGTYLVCPFIMHELHHAGLGLIRVTDRRRCCAARAVGVINGYFVAVIGITSFVTTLGTLFALSGLTLIISHSTQITPTGTTILGDSSGFEKIFGTGTYSELFWALGIVIILQIALTFTQVGDIHRGGGLQPARRQGGRHQRAGQHHPQLRGVRHCWPVLVGVPGGDPVDQRHARSRPAPRRSCFQAISAAVIGGHAAQRRHRAPWSAP